jgi:hypothetical protein
MGRARGGGLPALAAVLLAADGALAPDLQVVPQPLNRRIEERYAIGADLARYEALYGSPEFRGIDDEHARPWPRLQNVRTIAVLAPFGGRGGTQGAEAYPGRVIEYGNSYTNFMLCGDRYCIGVAPVEEMVEFFLEQGRTWYHRRVEAIGAIDQVGDPRDLSCPCFAFRVWSVHLFEETVRRNGRGAPTLETLVRGPEAAAGRSITVSGTFRGSNLFEDLPPQTRRHPGDWVLKDGPFSIWVTGRPPRGNGFSLDPQSRSECDWRLEVTGRVETAERYVYLRAKTIALVRREREEEEEER